MRLTNEHRTAPQGARFRDHNERDLRAALLELAGVVARLVKADADKAALAQVLRLLDATPVREPTQAERDQAAAERRAWSLELVESQREIAGEADPDAVARAELQHRAILGGAS